LSLRERGEREAAASEDGKQAAIGGEKAQSFDPAGTKGLEVHGTSPVGITKFEGIRADAELQAGLAVGTHGTAGMGFGEISRRGFEESLRRKCAFTVRADRSGHASPPPSRMSSISPSGSKDRLR